MRNADLQPSSWPAHLVYLLGFFRGVVGWEGPTPFALYTFHSWFVNWFGKFPNVPCRYVFRQLSSDVSHLHRTPLKRRQSAKIRTIVVWGAWERKSRSSACRSSNVGLPICLYPFLMQSTVLQIFIKVMIHAKPNLTTVSGSCVSVSFFWFVAYQPHQFCQISCANNQQVENLK